MNNRYSGGKTQTYQIKGEEFQFTLIGRYENEDKYFFKNFNNPDDLIAYVSQMSKGTNKVHKILKMYLNGDTIEMTIGFDDGRLGLITVK